MQRLNKEQTENINDIINQIVDGLVDNPTAKDAIELICFIQDYGCKEENSNLTSTGNANIKFQ